MRELAARVAVVKLNGGLGTSMGCVGPKSCIEIREGKTFLDTAVEQLTLLNQSLGTQIPLVLMNSFNTHEDTLKIIGKYEKQLKVLCFQQSQYPRLVESTLLPLAAAMGELEGVNIAPEDLYYPPGHGEFYSAFYNSGLLSQLKEQGIEYIFVANADNLGATLSWTILQKMVADKLDFVMELTPKTRADIKGGTLISYEGNAKLLELAQVPKEHVGEFQNISRFTVFNTNNIWMGLSAVQKAMESTQRGLELDIIYNRKQVQQIPIVQLETAIGAAVSCFERAVGIIVPRTRFLPVKTNNDLFLIQSDLFSLNTGSLTVRPPRQVKDLPWIRLGDAFKHVNAYMSRFQGSLPSVLQLDHLTVSGDVTFGSNITLKGHVIIVASDGAKVVIPDDSVLENVVVCDGCIIRPL